MSVTESSSLRMAQPWAFPNPVEAKNIAFEIGDAVRFEKIDCAFDSGLLWGYVVFDAHCCLCFACKLAEKLGIIEEFGAG